MITINMIITIITITKIIKKEECICESTYGLFNMGTYDVGKVANSNKNKLVEQEQEQEQN